MPKVSVIVPVYNVAKYLKDCLDSIVNQTFTDIEIICVNDASSDNSKTILEEYSKRDQRIKVITHKHNQGLGPARNTGIANATGEFISFVDSDDFVNPLFLEVLYELIVKTKAEMSWCGINTITENGNYLNSFPIKENTWTIPEVLNSEELYPSILPVWNKLFRKQLLKNIKQLQIVSEDQPVLAEYFLKCTKIVTTSKTLYNYRQNNNTLSKPVEPIPALWNDFFLSHSIFFNLLRNKYSKALRKQAILRHFSILWRINNFDILNLATWNKHENILNKQLKKDNIGLKNYSLILYWSLRILFLNSLSKKKKNILLKILMRLTQGLWLKRTHLWLLPYDMVWATLPNIKIYIKNKIDNIELFIISFFSLCYKLLLIKPLWLISERPDTAQDNGAHFYNYLQREQPHIKAYYIINKNSIQVKNLLNSKNIIQYNSLKHKVFFLAASYLVTSHNHYCFPASIFCKKKYNVPKKTQNIFLQHGITASIDVSNVYGKKNANISLFICGALPEYEYVKKNYGYQRGEVEYTGFARFDSLHKFNKKNYILLMPTWRQSIFLNKKIFLDKRMFRLTNYFKTFQSLLFNKNLIDLLNKFEIDLIFYPHYEIQKFLHEFSSTSKRIILADKEEYSVQNLLKESSLLITDTSSVSFDFAYMYKPIIYYLFDYKNYNLVHTKKGFFNYETMGFGKVTYNENDLLLMLEFNLKNGNKMTEPYKERVKSFFPLHDKKNCERIFNTINKNNKVKRNKPKMIILSFFV